MPRDGDETLGALGENGDASSFEDAKKTTASSPGKRKRTSSVAVKAEPVAVKAEPVAVKAEPGDDEGAPAKRRSSRRG